MLRFAILCAVGLPLAAQTITLGTAIDPCTGGSTFAAPAVRFGDFVCTFPVQADGLYTVRMDFLEPCYAAGVCGGGQITAAGQRSMNVYVQDSPALVKFDPFFAGATDKVVASRSVFTYSNQGKIIIRVETVQRSGVLAAVSLSYGMDTQTYAPSRWYLTAGPAPADTTINGKTFDYVMYCDSADSQCHVKAKNGTVSQIAITMQQCCSGLGLALLGGVPFITMPATAAQAALPIWK